MSSDLAALIGGGALVVVGIVAIPMLLRGMAWLRPGRHAADREQAMAQIRAFTVRSAGEGEPDWDGTVRGTPPTDEF